MAKRRVVITGAAGYVAQRMYPELAERWDLVPIDVRPTTRAGKAVPGLIVSDLTRPDRNLYREHFRGADAVIHCGLGGPAQDALRHALPRTDRPCRLAARRRQRPCRRA